MKTFTTFLGDKLMKESGEVSMEYGPFRIYHIIYLKDGIQWSDGHPDERTARADFWRRTRSLEKIR